MPLPKLSGPHGSSRRPFDIMPLSWFGSSAQSNGETQSALQSQFGRQRFLNEQTSDVVGTMLLTSLVCH